MKIPFVKNYFFWLGMLVASNSFAQNRDTLYLWPNKVPNEINVKHRPIQYPDTSRAVIRITDITNPSLTVFKPASTISNGASVLIAPGGGYKYLAINIEGYEVAEWLNTLGFTAFVLEYRTPNNKLGALNDMQRAIRLVREKASEMDLNPNKIGVIGFSAGGHLAMLASSNYNTESYPKTDAIDELSSRPDFALLLYPAYLDEGEDNRLSTNITLPENMPPLFIFGTLDDPLSNGFLVVAQALKKKKIPFEMHLLPEGGHGYGMRKGNPAAEKWPQFAEKWLLDLAD